MSAEQATHTGAAPSRNPKNNTPPRRHEVTLTGEISTTLAKLQADLAVPSKNVLLQLLIMVGIEQVGKHEKLSPSHLAFRKKNPLPTESE